MVIQAKPKSRDQNDNGPPSEKSEPYAPVNLVQVPMQPSLLLASLYVLRLARGAGIAPVMSPAQFPEGKASGITERGEAFSGAMSMI